MLGEALSIAVLSIILPVHLSGQSSSGIIGWGQQVFDSALNDQAFVQVAAGNYHTVARYGIAATIMSVGAGCGGAGMPVLAANAPRIGQDLTFTLTQATPNAFGILYISGIPASPIALGSGCSLELDLATLLPLLPLSTDATGSWTILFPLPFDPSLVATQFALQIVLPGTLGPFGFDLSNGLIATLGY